jgi:hypothetical protein
MIKWHLRILTLICSKAARLAFAWPSSNYTFCRAEINLQMDFTRTVFVHVKVSDTASCSGRELGEGRQLLLFLRFNANLWQEGRKE